MNFKYNKSVLGGTFDHLHLGHQKLLDSAFSNSKHVIIGLTMPVMYKNKFLSKFIEDYIIREANLNKYLQEKNYLNHATIVPIEDIFGPTIDDESLEAIFAVSENLPNVDLINKKRREIDFAELEVVLVDYEKADDDSNITSERIRRGEIDRNGFVYKNIFKQTLKLSDNLRDELRKPLGEIVPSAREALKKLNEKTIVISVGDVITSSLSDEGFVPALSIIDLRTRRKIIGTIEDYKKEKIRNEQGTIDFEAVNELSKKIDVYLSTSKNQTMVVDGEEDLLALPAILLAPLGSVVLYGQFDQGVVINRVDESFKEKIRSVLQNS